MIFNVLFVLLIPIMISMYFNIITMIYDSHILFLHNLCETIMKEHPTDSVLDISYQYVLTIFPNRYSSYPYSLFYPEFETIFREELHKSVLNHIETLIKNSVNPSKFIPTKNIFISNPWTRVFYK